MTLEEKLRFLNDRVKDEKEFYIDNILVRFEKGSLITLIDTLYLDTENLNRSSLKLKPTWEFTEDEKVILRNLEDRWNWIARDGNGLLWLYHQKPHKRDSFWGSSAHNFTSFSFFNHLFQSVQWEDDEPCEFRRNK